VVNALLEAGGRELLTARAVWAGASAGWAWAVKHCKPSSSDVAPQE